MDGRSDGRTCERPDWLVFRVRNLEIGGGGEGWVSHLGISWGSFGDQLGICFKHFLSIFKYVFNIFYLCLLKILGSSGDHWEVIWG